ncbi:hypothetical protein DL96DRAFT_1527350 [Flagelloscypha sp. PMI_526]|nr:hypothetical protein DL96DRAFT_1527350 [Flagelloscypha sp. PMI_526]
MFACRPHSSRSIRWLSTVNKPSDAKRAEVTLKRFWKTVELSKLDDGLVITLDKRPLKTPGGNVLLLPHSKSLAASLVAHEWDTQSTVLKPHALPVTSLVSRALDAMTNQSDRQQVQSSMLNYFDTDSVCFHSDRPPPLVSLQERHWVPLLDWARKTFSIEVKAFDSLIFQPQPQATKDTLLQVMSSLDIWQMAALERATLSSKSLIIGFALVMRHLDADHASQAAHVEVNSQIERWGEVEDTHDVDYRDIRRQLGSAACLLADGTRTTT